MARPHSIRFGKFHVWLSFTEQKLDFCVGVRADFAVQIDFFVLRRGPFHGYDSLVGRAQEEYHGDRTAESRIQAGVKGMQHGGRDEQEAKTCHNSS